MRQWPALGDKAVKLLHVAASAGHVGLLRQAAKKGADPNAVDPTTGHAPLLHTTAELRDRQTIAAVQAIKRGYPTAGLQALVDAGLDKCKLSWSSENDNKATVTALHAAASENCNAEAVRFLLEMARCDPRARDDFRWMPHQWAATYNCVPALEVLFGVGGVPPDVEANGITLHHAAVAGTEEAVGFLLKSGADPLRQSVDPEGRTRRPSELATEMGHRKLGRTLRERETAALAARQQAQWVVWRFVDVMGVWGGGMRFLGVGFGYVGVPSSCRRRIRPSVLAHCSTQYVLWWCTGAAVEWAVLVVVVLLVLLLRRRRQQRQRRAARRPSAAGARRRTTSTTGRWTLGTRIPGVGWWRTTRRRRRPASRVGWRRRAAQRRRRRRTPLAASRRCPAA